MLKPLTLWITANWKILQEMGIPDLRNMYSGQEATARTRHGSTDWFQIRKGVRQGCILSADLTYMQSTSCKMLGWMKHKLESRLPGEISLTQICRWYHPCGRKQRGTKEPLDESEREEWKSWLKTQYSKNEDHGIWSHHFTANRWGDNGNSDRFYFLGLQITADGDCSHEIKRHLLLTRKAMTNLDSILKAEALLCQQRSI